MNPTRSPQVAPCVDSKDGVEIPLFTEPRTGRDAPSRRNGPAPFSPGTVTQVRSARMSKLFLGDLASSPRLGRSINVPLWVREDALALAARNPLLVRGRTN